MPKYKFGTIIPICAFASFIIFSNSTGANTWVGDVPRTFSDFFQLLLGSMVSSIGFGILIAIVIGVARYGISQLIFLKIVKLPLPFVAKITLHFFYFPLAFAFTISLLTYFANFGFLMHGYGFPSIGKLVISPIPFLTYLLYEYYVIHSHINIAAEKSKLFVVLKSVGTLLAVNVPLILFVLFLGRNHFFD